jgi:hypothetical protein
MRQVVTTRVSSRWWTKEGRLVQSVITVACTVMSQHGCEAIGTSICPHLCKQLGRVAAPRREHQPQRLARVLVEQRARRRCCAADRLLQQHV